MPFNVLITAASRRVPLVRAFRRAIAPTGGRVAVADINPLSPAVHVADAAYSVPLSTDFDYLDHLLDICRLESIDLVVPAIDDELPVMAGAVRAFEAIGVKVAVSPEATTRLCNDKYALCQYLRAVGISAARSWTPQQVPADAALPLFIKPRVGRGGVQCFAARTRRELEFFLEYVGDPIVQEFLSGPEFTIDVMCGFDGRPRAAVPRERVVIRAGVIDRGRTVNDPDLIQLALDCVRAIPFVGAINVQCRVVDGVPTVFEINPRFSGGIPLTIAAGADFPRMLVDMARGNDVAPAIGRFQSDLWMTNYEDAIYLEQADMATLRGASEAVPASTVRTLHGVRHRADTVSRQVA
jgi:carbamoyl-phosphate synthase large subunit